MKILINGAGVAGPTLAWWLARSNHEVTLVERAPALRRGGYVVDFWGVGYDIAERMDILPRIREQGYQVQEVRFVDQSGETVGGFSTDVFARATNGRFTSIRRSDLAATIFDSLDGRVETVFSDSVAAIDDHGDCVRVSLERGDTREVDLVIGADGLHSRVRRLVFGDERELEVPLGYHVVAFEVGGYQPRDELVYVAYAVPGRGLSRFAMRDDRTLFLAAFRDEYLQPLEGTSGAEDPREVIRKIYSDLGWECARIVAAMDDADEIYFDRVSQIRMPRWASGRVALVGDAAACVSLLAGEGTGLAMAEAYVLAAELAAANGDHRAAFAAYERRMMPLLEKKQRSAADFASSFVPKSAVGIGFRNLVTKLLRFRPVAEWFIVRDLRDDIVLPPAP
ncbi:MAG TPA: FAD-binding domain [Gemmatimonadaceae bacterium]|jgi:2-polyprenyl-6-methoxyphenol hydroxylase-like FAD-dependent oxidoreductase|nr:FAD-binding domain [Gemmatimonadaceae bacterium]